jgi:hypothetical protein
VRGSGQLRFTPAGHGWDYGENCSAEYRFAGQGWRGVQGTSAVPAGPLTAVVGDAQTVLVNRDCVRNPRGPGC